MGILLHALFRLVDAHKLQHFNGSCCGLLLGAACMEQNCLLQLVADGKDRVKACHGVLKNHADYIAPNRADGLFIAAHQFPAPQLDAAGYDAAGMGQDLHDAISSHALAGTGFSHDAQHLAGLHIKGGIVHGFDFAGIGKEGCAKVTNFQQAHIIPPSAWDRRHP